MIRGIPVDVWEMRNHPREAGQQRIEVARIYYTKPNAVVARRPDLSPSDPSQPSQIPLRVDLKKSGSGDVEVINIFDFSASGDEVAFQDNFQIDDCQYNAQYVEIVLTGK